VATKTASAPGKIILSGEYAVVFGYPGIAIPLAMMTTATWEDTGDAPMKIQLRGQLGNESYARKIVDACAKKGGPMKGTLTIKNDVPVGKGLGSSTSLVVAIGKCLLGDKRADVLAVEDVINPGHSGLDFAVIWGQKPVMFKKGSTPEPIDLNLDFLKTAILIDTGMPLEGTPELVAWVKERKNELDGALSSIGNCTERLKAGESPMTVFPDHHKAQVALGVVPTRVQDIIRETERNDGAAKVVGAGGKNGGAGMVLALHTHTPITKKMAEKFAMPCFALV
jgi:mevalonate kinase